MGETEYLNKGLSRRRQIHNWFMEVVDNNFEYQRLFNKVGLLALSNITNSIIVFNKLVDRIISSNTTLGYILEKNINKFGRNKVILDLYNGIFNKRIRKIPKKKIPKTVQKELDDLKEELKQPRRKIIFGINKEGKKREAKVVTVLVKKKPQVRLRDAKTGRFLKQTKVFKERLKKVKRT